MKMEQTQRFAMLAFKLQTPGNHPDEKIKQSGINIIVVFLTLKVLNKRREMENERV
jgi:hypothetical protein